MAEMQERVVVILQEKLERRLAEIDRVVSDTTINGLGGHLQATVDKMKRERTALDAILNALK